MPPPVSADEFLAVVERSGLLQEDDLESYRFRATADPSPPDRVANWFVMDGLLTPFQVGLLLAGKSRPFFVGQYKVLSRIGNGSMGVVYLCEHREMQRRVAVKILQRRRARDEVALERFLREARAAAALNHPNVVHALDVGCEAGLHFLVMELINGPSLKELILTQGPLPPLKAANYLIQAARGVHHAHEAGLIHRDIKPSNLMIDRSGVLKILDLGLARFEDGEVDLTRGSPIGNVAYIAPEQALDSHAVDARADVYSLGATFYFALVGRPPTPALGIDATDPSPQSTTTDFSRLMDVLRRMTAYDPAKRYQTAAEVANELAAWALPIQPPEPSAALPIHSPEPAEPSAALPSQETEEPQAPTVIGPSESVDSDSAKQDVVSEPSPLLFDRKPRVHRQKVARAAIPAKPWWRVRHWQLVLLGLAAFSGLLAALLSTGKSAPAREAASKHAPAQ